MRQTLIDLAQRHASVRHGGDLVRTELTERIEQPDRVARARFAGNMN